MPSDNDAAERTAGARAPGGDRFSTWGLARPGAHAAVVSAVLGAVVASWSALPASSETKPAPSAATSLYAPDAVEREHNARYDRAIAEVRSYKVSAEDSARLVEAAKAFGSASLNKGLAARKAIQDPVAGKLADWYRLRSGYGTASEYRAFLDQNPAWPDRGLMTQRLEEALFTQGGNSRDIRAYFAKSGPDHGVGFAALASSYLAEGNTSEAHRYAAKAWREMSIPATLETGFLDRFGKLLTADDHKARLDRLLIDEVRWKGQRNERAAVVRRVIARLDAPERRKAEARLAVFLQQDGALQRVASLDVGEGASKDWGLVFHQVQALRRADRVPEAARLMLTAPLGSSDLANPDGWWVERRASAYAALRVGKPQLAYDLVRETGALSVNPLKEQTFMAGWLALRYLKDAERAAPHFAAFANAADGPLSRAKSQYWLGRLAEARGDKAAAQVAYQEATLDADTFHGQLAMQKLASGSQRFEIKPPKAPSPEEIARFNSLDAAKAVVVAKQAGLDQNVRRSFLVQLRFHLGSEAETAMIAHLAEAVGDTQMAVRTGKAGLARRQNLIYYAYPVHPFPAYTPLRKPPEAAFLLGVARQETEFNPQTVSGAGAKGLLQVMNVTAEHVCRDYKIKCDIKRVMSDPSYNTMLASAYIGDRMDDFRGSYILTLAGYNAGPGRARQWISQFGDPRDPQIDPIDWIERIPIQETREYVAKVLANVQVYRARLGNTDVALQLEQDLVRARHAGRTQPARETATGTAASGG